VGDEEADMQVSLLAADGFQGFVTVRELRDAGLQRVPRSPGAYVVLRQSEALPQFLDSNPGGHFKGENPTVGKDVLAAKWVAGVHLLYVGEGGDLHDRLRSFIRFGLGAPVGHRGGRYVWQVEGADSFAVAWRPTVTKQDAQALEQRLLQDFYATYGCLPFANLRF
jgi:hypothetical protein